MNTYFKRSFIAGTAALCTLTATLPTLPTYAEDIATLESKTAALQAQLSGLNQEMVSISDQITTTQMQVEITNGEILRTQEALATAQADEAKQYEDMKTRIKYMYETGNATLLEMLFSAETMTDFLNKADFIQNISSYDREMLEELQALQEEIAMEEATLIDQQTSLTELQTTLEGRQAALQATAAATSTDLASFSAQLTQLRAEEAQLAAQKAAAEAEKQNAAQNNGSSNKPNSDKPDENHSDNSSGSDNSGTAAPDPAPPAEPSVPESGGNSGGDDTVIQGGGTPNVSSSELDVFAAILQCEAYQDYDSMLAVATVIMNRVYSPLFPNTITEVIYAPGQFEPTWSGRLDTVLAQGPTALSYQVAQDAINGARLASVADCYYFLYAGATDRPGVNVGNNLFFVSW